MARYQPGARKAQRKTPTTAITRPSREPWPWMASGCVRHMGSKAFQLVASQVLPETLGTRDTRHAGRMASNLQSSNRKPSARQHSSRRGAPLVGHGRSRNCRTVVRRRVARCGGRPPDRFPPTASTSTPGSYRGAVARGVPGCRDGFPAASKTALSKVSVASRRLGGCQTDHSRTRGYVGRRARARCEGHPTPLNRLSRMCAASSKPSMSRSHTAQIGPYRRKTSNLKRA